MSELSAKDCRTKFNTKKTYPNFPIVNDTRQGEMERFLLIQQDKHDTVQHEH